MQKLCVGLNEHKDKESESSDRDFYMLLNKNGQDFYKL